MISPVPLISNKSQHRRTFSNVDYLNSSNVHIQTFLLIFQPGSSIPVAMETVSMDQEVSVLQSRNFSRSVAYHMADIIRINNRSVS